MKLQFIRIEILTLKKIRVTGFVDRLRLALSGGPNRVGFFPLSPEDGNR
jgi:hypothetical protein